jgi:hypothetical protein
MSKLIKFEDRTKPTMVVECIETEGWELLELGQRYEAYVSGTYTRIPNQKGFPNNDNGFYTESFKVLYTLPLEVVKKEGFDCECTIDYYPYLLTLKGSGNYYRWNVMKPDGYSKCFETKDEAHNEILRLKEAI